MWCDVLYVWWCFFFSSRRRHTRLVSDWSSDVCSSDLQLVRANKSPESGDYRVTRLSKTADKITYRLEGTPVSFDAEVSKSGGVRSEERRVGKECRSRWWAYD